jgi:hypothetical protein
VAAVVEPNIESWAWATAYRNGDAISPDKTDKCRRFACDDCRCNSASNSGETKKTGPRETVLEEADRIVNGSRNASYGDPAGNHGCTAAMVTAYLRRRGYLVEGAEVDDYDICWINTLQKASRDANTRKRDNLVDAAGYMRNAELIGPDG